MSDKIEPTLAAAAPCQAKAGAAKHRGHHHGHTHVHGPARAHHAFHHAVAHAGRRAARSHPGGADAAHGAASLPDEVEGALRTAMAREGAPPSWADPLRFLVNKESGGQVDVQNPHHSARGLFQLTASNYALNPRGAASFGDAVEEAQGGIRYIRARYGSAEAAADFWRKKGWF